MVVKLLILLIFALNGFGIFKLSNTLILLPIVIFANDTFMQKSPFRNILIIILMCIILSFVPAYIYRGQSFIETFKASANYFYIITFFAICKLKPTLKDIEKAMVYLSLITSFLYLVQLVLLPIGIAILPITNALEASSAEAARFRIAGSGIFSLAFFYGINRYVISNKLKYLGVAIINLMPLIIMGFRTMLAGIALFSVVLLLKTTGGRIQKIFKYIIVASLLVLTLMQVPAVKERVDYMIEKQADGDQSFSNSDYIRIVQFDYFTQEYPLGILDRGFGSGSPYVYSDFGVSQYELNEMGIFWVDWGLIGLSWIIGPFTVLAMIWLNIICCRLIPNKSYLYIAIWFVYLIAVSVLSAEYFRTGNFVIHSIALYIAYRAYMVNRRNLIRKNYEDRNINLS